MERDLVALPARMGGLGLTNPSEIAEVGVSGSNSSAIPPAPNSVCGAHTSTTRAKNKRSTRKADGIAEFPPREDPKSLGASK